MTNPPSRKDKVATGTVRPILLAARGEARYRALAGEFAVLHRCLVSEQCSAAEDEIR